MYLIEITLVIVAALGHRCGDERIAAERRRELAGLDDAHAYASVRQLEVHGLAERLEGVLTGGVDAAVRRAHSAGDRPDDLERTLLRVMAEQRLTRRVLLERMGKLGAGVALAPIVAACASAGMPPGWR